MRMQADRGLINRFLSEREAQERGIFISRYYYMRICREIAEKLSLPEHRIRYVLKKLRTALKNYLESEGVTV